MDRRVLECGGSTPLWMGAASKDPKRRRAAALQEGGPWTVPNRCEERGCDELQDHPCASGARRRRGIRLLRLLAVARFSSPARPGRRPAEFFPYRDTERLAGTVDAREARANRRPARTTPGHPGA